MILPSTTGRPYVAVTNKGDHTLMVHPMTPIFKGTLLLILQWRFVTSKETLGEVTLPDTDVVSGWGKGSYSARTQSCMATGITVKSIGANTGKVLADLAAKVWDENFRENEVLLADAELREDFTEDFDKLWVQMVGQNYYPVIDLPKDLIGKSMKPSVFGTKMEALSGGKVLKHSGKHLEVVENEPENTGEDEEVDNCGEDAATSSLDKVIPLVPKTDA